MEIFLATKNENKIKEIKNIFFEEKIKIMSILDGIKIPSVRETGKTFEENSRKKALEISKTLNMITIADDSGLCVKALGNEPGVYSSRFAGKNANDTMNNNKLINELKNITDRSAKFVCVISLAKQNGEIYSYRGELSGYIIDTPRGNNGFGYDPYFYVEEYEKTLAEIPNIKSKISHRAIALDKLKNDLNKIFPKI